MARKGRDENMIDLRILTVPEAVEWLRSMGMKIGPDTLRWGIEQKQFPFGNVVRTDQNNVRCYVYSKKLLEWAAEMGYETEERGEHHAEQESLSDPL